MELDAVTEHLADRVERGEIAESDAVVVQTFAEFLRETPARLKHDLGNAPDYFPDRPAFEDWRARWLPFLLGFADGPTSREEYAELRPKIFRAHPELDSFHT